MYEFWDSRNGEISWKLLLDKFIGHNISFQIWPDKIVKLGALLPLYDIEFINTPDSVLLYEKQKPLLFLPSTSNSPYGYSSSIQLLPEFFFNFWVRIGLRLTESQEKLNKKKKF